MKMPIIVKMIPALVLAAGKSTRMGRLKATLPAGGGETFLSRIIRTFRRAGVEDVVVVVGHQADAVRNSVADAGITVRFVENADYELGQFSSLSKGLGAVDRPEVEAVLLTLVDVPFVGSSTVRAVVDRYLHTHVPVVRPTRGAEHGHPVLIDRALFGRIHAADPSTGAKPIIRAYASTTGDFAVDDAGAFVDVDTSDDYERALGMFSPSE